MSSYKINSQDKLHFLTLTVVGWLDVFTRKIYRDILLENLQYCQENKGLEIFGYVIMSNHLHLLARSEVDDLSGTIRDFKSFTSKRILSEIQEGNESRKEWMMRVFSFAAAKHKRNSSFQFWTHENHAIEIYSQKFIEQKLNYIHENPVRAGIVLYPEEYLYSSAKNYAGEPGLIEVSKVHINWKTIR